MATISNRYTAALGPFRMEVMFLTSVSNDDTVETLIQGPIAALMVPAADAAATTQNQSVTVSGKTLTLRDPAVTAQTVIVFGL